jgi:hypothetical protein
MTHEKAFLLCPSLTSVMFCNKIQEFVSEESMRDWWDQGIHGKYHKEDDGLFSALLRRLFP